MDSGFSVAGNVTVTRTSQSSWSILYGAPISDASR